jgi:hypothetical protein
MGRNTNASKKIVVVDQDTGMPIALFPSVSSTQAYFRMKGRQIEKHLNENKLRTITVRFQYAKEWEHENKEFLPTGEGKLL